MKNELVQISPEGLNVAQTYLQCLSIPQTARQLNIAEHEVSNLLDNKHVKQFISNVFMEQGYNNRWALASAMDDVIKRKLEEIEETGLGSTKDIAELLQMKHKMRMDELNAEIKLEQARGPASQTNVQVNAYGTYGENYGNLLEKLARVK